MHDFNGVFIPWFSLRSVFLVGCCGLELWLNRCRAIPQYACSFDLVVWYFGSLGFPWRILWLQEGNTNIENVFQCIFAELFHFYIMLQMNRIQLNSPL